MKVLFEIPIHATSEIKYYQKWENHISAELERFCKDAAILDGEIDIKYIENARKRRERTERSKVVEWKYSTIIGFLLIGIDEPTTDIIFDVVLEKKPHRYNSKTRKEKMFWNMLGEHFSVLDAFSNEDISNKIVSTVERLRADELKEYYLDTNTFYNIIYSIDYRRIFELN